MDTNNGNLPRGERWWTSDTLCWFTFSEVRAATCDFMFPRREWSRNWQQWPPQSLSFALTEIETGIPWQPSPDEMGPFGPDYERKWARRIMANTGESAGQLLAALTSDIERYCAIQEKFRQDLAELNAALGRGRLRLWAIKRLAPSKSDPDGTHELIDPLKFMGGGRLSEDGRIINNAQPSHDRAFLDSAEVTTLWPVPSPSAGIASCDASLLPVPKQPSPQSEDTPMSVPPKRKHTGLDYKASDAPLVKEMRDLIESGKARSVTDAARAVYDRAAGWGKPASKVARLVKHYGETYPDV